MTKYTNSLIEKIIKENKDIYNAIYKRANEGILLYGAGFLGKWACSYLQDKGASVKYFVDRDEKKWGTTIEGVEVISPTDKRVEETPYMLITVRYFVKDIESMYKDKGIAALPFLAYHILENYKEYADVRDNYMCDEKSVETYNALLYASLLGDTTACEELVVPKQYFALAQFSGAVQNEIFVDAGAYVGDTIEEFIWENKAMFRKIYAFEPGAKQYAAMYKRVERLCEEWYIDRENITLINAGVSEKTTKMSLETGQAERVGDYLVEKECGNTVDVYSLDDYFKGEKVTFIKADVEGMEMQLLKGAKETICKYKPKLAICVYHYPNDLYDIARYIKSLNPNYSFKLRLHIPELSEYVLYCY